jgi:hypothetical protein
MADNWRTYYDATNSPHFAEGYLLDVSRRLSGLVSKVFNETNPMLH